MSQANGTTKIPSGLIIRPDELVLVTGAAGFIGSSVVECLLNLGFNRVRCFARNKSSKLEALATTYGKGRIEIFRGNLQSREDCVRATDGVAVVLHLAAGAGEKSFPDAFINSVVTTRNLLDACLQHRNLKRFVNVSSFAVYTNRNKPQGSVLDETCPVEAHVQDRKDPYCFAKVKQDELVAEYGKNFGVPYVIVRPGYVYGPGKTAITGRVGLDTFGFFLHFGGSNQVPFSYVDNCAEAIVLAGTKPGVDGEVFNIVDDDLYTSRKFLRLYKKKVGKFRTFYVPRTVSYAFCSIWERYSDWSAGQLPPAFNRGKWHSLWKRTSYSNRKLKQMLGWSPKVSTAEGLERYFAACRSGLKNA
jgi:nucleoside-diphosphate-sugar epimerase